MTTPHPTARDPGAASPADGLRAEIERLTARLAAHEARLATLAADIDSLQRSGEQAEWTVDDLRAAVEPLRLAAAGGMSPAQIARHGDYLGMVARLRRAVRTWVPREARVLVIGRGDEALVQLSGRRAAHFPQDAAGDFAGEYPADGAAAVAQLESLAAHGWDHLVIPATSAWWLDHYGALRIHLHRHWHAVHRDTETCLIFARQCAGPGAWQAADGFLESFRCTAGRWPAILDWDTGAELASFFPGCAVFPPVVTGADRLPYLERSIDIVAVPAADPARRAEARRIASAAVLTVALPGVAGPGFTVTVDAPGGSPGGVGLIVPPARP